jgi:hypothetical protein
MDFRTPASGDFRLMYALPLGPRRVLVEHVSHRRADHAAHIRAYLDAVLGLRGWEVVDREAGATPLYAPAPARRSGRLVRLGVAAGLAKACTGYALTRMWRDAELIATALGERGEPALPRRPGALYRIADRLFLDLLRRSPERLPEFLVALCGAASGDALLAFLDERASSSQRLEVARAAPGWIRWRLRERRPRLARPATRCRRRRGRLPTPAGNSPTGAARHRPTSAGALLRSPLPSPPKHLAGIEATTAIRLDP